MTKELRRFGVVAGITWGTLSFLLWKKQGSGVCLYLFFFSLFLLITGLVKPQILKPIYKIWTGFTHFLGGVNTRVILGVIFFLVVTPLGFILRLLGKDFLNLKINPNSTTYWIPKNKSFSKSDYENQF